MRFDVEIATAQTVADYLNKVVAPDTLKLCPCVTFFDPMSVQDANRIVVMVPSGRSNATSPGNFTAQVDIGIKSQWAQASLQADFAAHFERVNSVRDKLWPTDLADRLNEKTPAGMAVEFVQPQRDFNTSVREGWIYSETTLTLQVMVTTGN